MLLQWSYNLDGAVISEKEWTFEDKRIATVLSSGGINIDPAFSSSVQVSGNRLTLLNVQEKDSGIYEFRVRFTTFNPRWIVDRAQVIVVGKFPYPYSHYMLTVYYAYSIHCTVYWKNFRCRSMNSVSSSLT